MADTAVESTTIVVRRGGFKKGQSGNPKGRPMKSYSSAEQIRSALVDELPKVLATVVKAAIGGDIKACEIVIRTCVAPLKQVEPPVTMPALAAGASLTQQGGAILQAVADGKLAPGQAASLLMGLSSQARVLEVDELKSRVQALEEDRAKEH